MSGTMLHKCNLNLLIVEDEADFNESLQYTLTPYFKHVDSALDGATALKMFCDHSPDIAIVDIDLPDMSGIQLIKEIHKYNHKINVVFLSAHDEKEYLLDAIKLHPFDYLLKPISTAKLFEALTSCTHAIRKCDLPPCNLGNGAHYNFDTKTIGYDNREYALTHKEIALLELLIAETGKVVGYQMIEEHVWTEDFMSSNALKILVNKLRKKLPKNSVTNIINVGYRLNTGS